jgi:hypothetical protein
VSLLIGFSSSGQKLLWIISVEILNVLEGCSEQSQRAILLYTTYTGGDRKTKTWTFKKKKEFIKTLTSEILFCNISSPEHQSSNSLVHTSIIMTVIHELGTKCFESQDIAKTKNKIGESKMQIHFLYKHI